MILFSLLVSLVTSNTFEKGVSGMRENRWTFFFIRYMSPLVSDSLRNGPFQTLSRQLHVVSTTTVSTTSGYASLVPGWRKF